MGAIYRLRLGPGAPLLALLGANRLGANINDQLLPVYLNRTDEMHFAVSLESLHSK